MCPKKFKFQNQTPAVLGKSLPPYGCTRSRRRRAAHSQCCSRTRSGNPSKLNISAKPLKLRDPPPPAWSCCSQLPLPGQQSPSKLHRRSQSPIIAIHTAPLPPHHTRRTQPTRASSPLQRYPAHRRGSSEATSGLGGRRTKKPPSLRLATAPSGALAEPLNAERCASPRTSKARARKTCPRASWPAATHSHSLPGTYRARAAQLVPSPPPACWHLRASAAAGVDGERPRARPASASLRCLPLLIAPSTRTSFPQLHHFLKPPHTARSGARALRSAQAPKHPCSRCCPKLLAMRSRRRRPQVPPCLQAPRHALPSALLTPVAGSAATAAIAANSPKLRRS